MAEAYPLQWPAAWPRTGRRVRARYSFGSSNHNAGAAGGRATQELLRQIRLLGATGHVISTNIELRQDGLPYANRRTPDDPGVAVYFTLKGQQRCIPCDRWDRVADNVYAIARTIDALRQLERDGTKGIVEAAFSGFRALPALGGTVGRNWWEVLEVTPPVSRQQIEDSYRGLARSRHPDACGGERAAWDELEEAARQARQAVAV